MSIKSSSAKSACSNIFEVLYHFEGREEEGEVSFDLAPDRGVYDLNWLSLLLRFSASLER